jgi:hypothetical protein
VQDACLPVQKLWAEEFCDRMSPERFHDALVTGRIPVGLPPAVLAKLQPLLDEARSQIEAPYLEAWGRTPHQTEWLAVLYRTGLPLDLPDGTRINRFETIMLVAALCTACTDEMPFNRFAGLLAVGLPPAPFAGLPPEAAKRFAARRHDLVELLTRARKAPPAPEDWPRLAALLVQLVGEQTLLAPKLPEPPDLTHCGPEPDDDCYYGDEVPELVQHLWSCCEMDLEPAAFAVFWRTGHPPVLKALGRAEQFVAARAQTRRDIAEAYLTDRHRVPTEAEWEAMFDPSDYLFTLPDGVAIRREFADTFFPELYGNCGGDLSRQDLLALAISGLNPENSADLAPDVVEAITERLDGMTEIITEARQGPPTREDWLALFKLAGF